MRFAREREVVPWILICKYQRLAASDLPIAVIGAGPVGLAGRRPSRRLVARSPSSSRAGASVGTSVLDWGHVRVFSPWRYNVDPAAAIFSKAGWIAPDPDAYPTGQGASPTTSPLAALPAIDPALRLGTRVVGVTRDGFDKMKTEGRETAPFVLRVARRPARRRNPGQGGHRRLRHVPPRPTRSARPVSRPSASAPRATASSTASPTCSAPSRDRYAGRGACWSWAAATRRSTPCSTWSTWPPRRRAPDHLGRSPPGWARVFGGGIADALPARGELGRARAAGRERHGHARHRLPDRRG